MDDESKATLVLLKQQRIDLINGRGMYKMLSEEEYDNEYNTLLYNITCLEALVAEHAHKVVTLSSSR
jgi:hypothetical protein